jgi:hypothetical protein
MSAGGISLPSQELIYIQKTKGFTAYNERSLKDLVETLSFNVLMYLSWTLFRLFC